MKNLIYHFPTCYAYSVKKPIGELNLKRALDEFKIQESFLSSFPFFHLLSSSPLGHMNFLLRICKSTDVSLVVIQSSAVI